MLWISLFPRLDVGPREVKAIWAVLPSPDGVARFYGLATADYRVKKLAQHNIFRA